MTQTAQEDLNIVVLSGGVGGTKLVDGLARCVDHARLQVIGNVADDEEIHGLWVSPDIDTLTYTLAGVEGPAGWGVDKDSFCVLDQLKLLGRPSWMALGDRDLATHIFRTEQRRRGRRPTEIAAEIAARLGVEVRILLPTDDPIQTRVRTAAGWLSFQEYFVRERQRPRVLGVRVDGLESSSPTPESLKALVNADLIIIAPSNPIVSIAPILGVPGIEEAIAGSRAITLAVSPLIGGTTVKGPADRMMIAMGHSADVFGVLSCYGAFLEVLVIDEIDCQKAVVLRKQGVRVHIDRILMTDRTDRARLAASIIDVGRAVLARRAAG